MDVILRKIMVYPHSLIYDLVGQMPYGSFMQENLSFDVLKRSKNRDEMPHYSADTASEPLAQYLRKSLRIYSYLPPLVALLLSVGMSFTAFHYETQEDLELLKSIDEDVAEVLALGDLSHVERLFRSVKEESKSEVLLLRGNAILVSTAPRIPKGSVFYRPKALYLTNGTAISKHGLLTYLPVTGALPLDDQSMDIVMLTPFAPIMIPILRVAVLVLLIGMILCKIYSYRIERSFSRALEPVSKLDASIRSLPYLGKLEFTEKTGVQEFDSILKAVTEAHRELANARDSLAAIRQRK